MEHSDIPSWLCLCCGTVNAKHLERGRKFGSVAFAYVFAFWKRPTDEEMNVSPRKLPVEVLRCDLPKPPMPLGRLVSFWRARCAARAGGTMTDIPSYSVWPWESSWNPDVFVLVQDERPCFALFFPLSVVFRIVFSGQQWLLPQTSPLRRYLGFRLNRERREAIVETSEGCPDFSTLAMCRRLPSPLRESPAFYSPRPLCIFLGKHLPSLDLEQFFCFVCMFCDYIFK